MPFSSHQVPLSSVLIGLSSPIVWLVLAALLPWLMPYDGLAIVAERWALPNSSFILGTDNLGRDLLSRLLLASANTLKLSIMTLIIALSVGVGLCVVANVLVGGRARGINQVVNMANHVPTLLWMLLVLPISAPGYAGVVIGICYALVFYEKACLHLKQIDLGIPLAASAHQITRSLKALPEQTSKRSPNARSKTETLLRLVQIQLIGVNAHFLTLYLLVTTLGFIQLGITAEQTNLGTLMRENLDALLQQRFAPVYPALLATLISAAIYATTFAIKSILMKSLAQTHASAQQSTPLV